jgi:hypothetical protein
MANKVYEVLLANGEATVRNPDNGCVFIVRREVLDGLPCYTIRQNSRTVRGYRRIIMWSQQAFAWTAGLELAANVQDSSMFTTPEHVETLNREARHAS